MRSECKVRAAESRVGSPWCQLCVDLHSRECFATAHGPVFAAVRGAGETVVADRAADHCHGPRLPTSEQIVADTQTPSAAMTSFADATLRASLSSLREIRPRPVTGRISNLGMLSSIAYGLQPISSGYTSLH